MRKRIAMAASLVCLLLISLNLYCDLSQRHGSGNRPVPDPEVSDFPEKVAGYSEGDGVQILSKGTAEERIRLDDRGGFARDRQYLCGDESSAHLSVLAAQQGVRLFYIRSRANLGHSLGPPDHQQLLESAVAAAVDGLQESSSAIVFDLDAVATESNHFILEANPELDLTEVVKREFEALLEHKHRNDLGGDGVETNRTN